MSLGIFPVFDSKDVPESGSLGECLADAIEWLDDLADELEILGLSDFVAHPDIDVPEDFDGSPEELDSLWAGVPPTWHAAADGRKAVSELREAVESAEAPDEATYDDEFDLDAVAAELRDLEEHLGEAERRGARFYLTIG